MELPVILLRHTRILAQDEILKKEEISDWDPHIARSIAEEFQPLFMQEALLFDKICLLSGDWSVDGLAAMAIRGIAEGSGDVFSFIKLDDVWSYLEAAVPDLPPEDFITSFRSLLGTNENVRERLYKVEEGVYRFQKTLVEIDKNFPEFLPLKERKKPRTRGTTKPQKQKLTPERLDEYFRSIEAAMVEGSIPLYDFAIRVQTLKLEYVDKAAAMPLLPYTSYLQKLPNSRKHDIAQLVIHHLPLPDRNTRWEQIIEYRENAENRKDLLGLRRWIRKLSTEDLSPAECAEELEWLQSEFQAHMRLHKIKADTGTLEVLVKAPLEILENLVTLKFSKLVDPLFAIKKRQISLMEAELNAPGREIAYLIKAKQAFE